MELTEKNNLISELQNWIYCHEKILTVYNSEDTVCHGCPLDFHTDLSCTRFTLIDSKQVHTIEWRLQYDESIWRKIAINSGTTFKIKSANDKRRSAYLFFGRPNDSFSREITSLFPSSFLLFIAIKLILSFSLSISSSVYQYITIYLNSIKI